MLVLSRKKNEATNVGETIRVVVVEIRGGKVRLGFEAPKTIPIARAELGTLSMVPKDVINVDALIEGARQAGTCSGLAMQLSCVAANCEGEFGALLDSVVDRLDAVENSHFKEPQVNHA